jgi:preprotein translocase subunit SecE
MILLVAPSILHLLISFLILLVVLAVIAGLVWAIENWISPLPPPVKMVLAIILVLLVIIWAIQQFGTGG